jgi:hypothetical protein
MTRELAEQLQKKLEQEQALNERRQREMMFPEIETMKAPPETQSGAY